MLKGSQLILGLIFTHLGVSFGFADTALQSIRLSRDGAGPSHIFWLTGPGGPFPDRDVIGIVDPLLAAIRFYTVARSAPGGPRLDARLESVGACALPVDFRPWRILQRKDAVYVEGMPKATKDGQNTKLRDFKTTQVTVSRTLVLSETLPALTNAGKTIDKTSWDPTKAISCGASDEGAVGRSSPSKAARGINRPNRTIILTTTADALSGPGALSVRAERGDMNYLYAVKELEPAGELRIVHITEGVPTKDGMVRFNQRLLIFGKNGTKPIGEIKFDDTLFRSKIGQRPLAILPTGEVLAMGKLGDGTVFEKSFRVQSCGFVGSTTTVNPTLCSNESDAVLARQDADATPATQTATPGGQNGPSKGATTSGETARSIFERVAKLANTPWKVDAGALPEACRRAAGCAVTGEDYPFVPLKGIRLTRGPYTQAGLPYAQTESLRDYDRFTTEGPGSLHERPTGRPLETGYVAWQPGR